MHSFNRVTFRVGDVAEVCRWAISETDEHGGRLKGAVRIRQASTVEGCENVAEAHQHVKVMTLNAYETNVCGGILSPSRRVLMLGDKIRYEGRDEVVTSVHAWGFVLRSKSVLWASCSSLGLVHADGLEIEPHADGLEIEAPPGADVAAAPAAESVEEAGDERSANKEERVAWDGYVAPLVAAFYATALVGAVTGTSTETAPEEPAAAAARIADELLRLRRKRFGP